MKNLIFLKGVKVLKLDGNAQKIKAGVNSMNIFEIIHKVIDYLDLIGFLMIIPVFIVLVVYLVIKEKKEKKL